MAQHPGPVDVVNYVTIRPVVSRAYWDRGRAWNGADVELTVETRWVPDGTEIELEILSATGVLVEKLKTKAKTKDNRAVVKHKIEWTSDHLADLAGDREHEFVFYATIPDFDLRGRSNALYVDLGGYVVSG